MVEYDNATWVAKRTNTNVTPIEGNDWAKMVSVAGAFTWEANGLLGAKNLLPFPSDNMGDVKYGITHQAYNDGSVHVEGTCTSSGGYAIRLTEEYVEIPSEWIGKSFTISEGDTAATTPARNIVLFDSEQVQIARHYARTTDATFEIPSNAVYWRALISVSYQVEVDVTLYPMLRLAEDTDGRYKSPTKTNKQLTDDVFALSKIGENSQSEITPSETNVPSNVSTLIGSFENNSDHTYIGFLFAAYKHTNERGNITTNIVDNSTATVSNYFAHTVPMIGDGVNEQTVRGTIPFVFNPGETKYIRAYANHACTVYKLGLTLVKIKE